LLVEAALTDIRARLERAPAAAPLVADIGTGSGAIAIAVAVHEPRVDRIYATDFSAEALALAAKNIWRAHVVGRVTLFCGDLLEPLPEVVDVLLANLPYVPLADAPTLPRDVRTYEPASALFGGDDGLDHLRSFFAQAPAHLRAGATIYAEFGIGQAPEVTALAREALPGAEVTIEHDYAGWERYVVVRT
jgi:release factor glutamine methyltransferase